MDKETRQLYLGVSTSVLESIFEDQKKLVDIHTKMAENHHDLTIYYRATSQLLERIIADRVDKSPPLSSTTSVDS